MFLSQGEVDNLIRVCKGLTEKEIRDTIGNYYKQQKRLKREFLKTEIKHTIKKIMKKLTIIFLILFVSGCSPIRVFREDRGYIVADFCEYDGRAVFKRTGSDKDALSK